MSPQYGELGPLTAEISSGVWGTPANFIGFHVLPSLLQRHCWPEANQTARCLAISWAGTLHFRGLLTPDRILLGAKFTLHPSLAFAYIGSVTVRHSSPTVGASQTLRRGTRNGIMELLQRAPPIFNRAAITMGIRPHSSFFGISPTLSSSSQ